MRAAYQMASLFTILPIVVPLRETPSLSGFLVGGKVILGNLTIHFFTGTSTAVYGIFNWANLGLLSATYTLDGNVFPQSYPVTIASAQYLKGDAEAINFLYFSQDNLSAGDHTLVINVTEGKNQMFILDYITYTPSFSTLATMPNLTVTSSVSPSPLSTGSNTPTPTSGSNTATPTSGSTAQNGVHDGTTTKKVPIGAIAGGVVGGVILLALLALLIIWLRKRRSNTDSTPIGPGTALNPTSPYLLKIIFIEIAHDL